MTAGQRATFHRDGDLISAAGPVRLRSTRIPDPAAAGLDAAAADMRATGDGLLARAQPDEVSDLLVPYADRPGWPSRLRGASAGSCSGRIEGPGVGVPGQASPCTVWADIAATLALPCSRHVKPSMARNNRRICAQTTELSMQSAQPNIRQGTRAKNRVTVCN